MKNVRDVVMSIERYRSEHGVLPTAAVMLAEDFDQMIDDPKTFTGPQMTEFGLLHEVQVAGVLVRRLARGVIVV